MQRLRTVTSLDVSAVAGHHAMPAALLFLFLHDLLNMNGNGDFAQNLHLYQAMSADRYF